MRNTIKFNVRQFRKLLFSRARTTLSSATFPQTPNLHGPSNICSGNSSGPTKPINYFTCSTTLRHLNTTKTATSSESDGSDEEEDVEPIEGWEEEDEAEPEIGDGGDGGGVVLQNCSWGEQALSLAKEVLLEFGEDIELFGFKTSPRGYVYVRIDNLSTEYGCPSIEVIEDFSRQFKKKLDEAGESGELPDDLALEVSSPSAERLLKVPEDLSRFKHMPMTVNFINDSENNNQVKTSVFYLECIDMETERCIWKLADVKENIDPSAKGRPLSRKLKDWRLQLPFTNCKKVTLYLGY
ncbi:hypothetical protein LIER_34573 [Lithospermum erythrorhizon]|uniref:DUF7912 domain-containing protein n=1 Tax=Lithospermum erythrorhizon TaxID=34254 RepID=A0AAV3S275_LITER